MRTIKTKIGNTGIDDPDHHAKETEKLIAIYEEYYMGNNELFTRAHTHLFCKFYSRLINLGRLHEAIGILRELALRGSWITTEQLIINPIKN